MVRINQLGKVDDRLNAKTDQKGLKKVIKWLSKEDFVALEAGNFAFYLSKHIEKNVGCQVVVLNPGNLATIYNSMKKTDKEDALKLARLISRIPREELPEVKAPTEKEQKARAIASNQAHLVTARTMHYNRLHSIFVNSGITTMTKKHLQAKKKRRGYAESQLNDNYRDEGLILIDLIENLDRHLDLLDVKIQEFLNEYKQESAICMSMPGIGPKNTLAIIGYLGDCSRFSSGSQVSNYVGLVPKVDMSGNCVHYGKIIRGCVQIKRIIIQAAWAMIGSKYGTEMRIKYDKIKKRRGAKRAVIAIARRMVEVLYVMIKNGEYYHYMPIEALTLKLEGYGIK